MPVALLAQVHHEPTTRLLLQRVPKAKLADAANAVGWDQREQRKRAAVAQQIALGRGRAAVAHVFELLHGGDTRLLHFRPLKPAAHALLVHLLRLAGLLCLAAQVDQLRQRARVHRQQRVAGREVGVAVRRDGDQAIEVVRNGREFASLRRFQPLRILLRDAAKIVANHERDGIANHRPVCRLHPAKETEQRRVVGLCRDRLHRATRPTSCKRLGSVEQVSLKFALERWRHALQNVRLEPLLIVPVS